MLLAAFHVLSFSPSSFWAKIIFLDASNPFCRIPLLLLLLTVAWKYASANLSLHILLDLFLINAIISSPFRTEISSFILPSQPSLDEKCQNIFYGVRFFFQPLQQLCSGVGIENFHHSASETHWKRFSLCQAFDSLCVHFTKNISKRKKVKLSFVIFKHWGLRIGNNGTIAL